MKRKTFTTNYFENLRFLPVVQTMNDIEIFHPFANLANEYFTNQGYTISPRTSDSIKISFESLQEEEKIVLVNEIEKFLKNSRQKVINDFLIYKSGISCI